MIAQQTKMLALVAAGVAHWVEVWGRCVPLILEKETAVDFKEIAKFFITDFGRPPFQESFEQSIQ